jgi:hypothetical protein
MEDVETRPVVLEQSTRPRAEHPYRESLGKYYIAGGVLSIPAFPCLWAFIAVAVLATALRAGLDLGAIAFGAVLFGAT